MYVPNWLGSLQSIVKLTQSHLCLAPSPGAQCWSTGSPGSKSGQGRCVARWHQAGGKEHYLPAICSGSLVTSMA